LKYLRGLQPGQRASRWLSGSAPKSRWSNHYRKGRFNGWPSFADQPSGSLSRSYWPT